MKLVCAVCCDAKEVADRLIGDVPLADWWASVGERCRRCRSLGRVPPPPAAVNECCPTCGAKTVEYKHTLNVPLAQGLVALCRAGKPTNLKELGLTRNQWDNFQKLRYWQLVEQHHDNGQRKAGVWGVTNRGVLFALDKLALPRSVWTYRGTTRRYEGEPVGITQLVGFYQPREQWAQDAVAALP